MKPHPLTSTTAPVRLLLPSRDGDDALCLHIDADGAIRSHTTVSPQHPLPAMQEETVRNVLAVPGSEVRSLWLELQARSEAQAVAAARMLLDGRLAGPREDVHIALAPASGDTNRRQVFCIESSILQARLDHARRLGIEADVVLPDYMLLPSGGDNTPRIAVRDGQWLVCDGEHAFATEPGLATLVLGEQQTPAPIDNSTNVETLLARGALHPSVNLLQHRFARRDARPEGSAAWRRAAILAGVLALSPLLLVAVEAARYAIAAAGLRSESASIAREFTGDIDNTDPASALQEASLQAQSGESFPRISHALFAAIAATPGLRIEQLDYADGRLQAAVFHDTTADLESLEQRLVGDGLQAQLQDTRDDGGGRVSTIVLQGAGT